MRIALSAGHNVYIGKYFDPGAVRNPYIEAVMTRLTVKELIPLLENQGHVVKDVTPYNERFSHKKDHHVKRCKAVDDFNADIYLDIHINAGGAKGVECWVHNMGSKSVPYAKKICNNISTDVGIPNRGVKIKPGFWSVSLTAKPAIIIEGGFIDSTDMNKLTPKNYSKSVAKVFGKLPSLSKKTTSKKVSKGLYRVRKSSKDAASQIGAFEDINNAKRFADNNTGYKVFDEQGVQIYPVVGTKAKQKKGIWEYYITGSIVKDLQRELNSQFKKGLKVDGWFGQDTINALVTVRKGAKGNLTRIIQKRLIAKGYNIGKAGVDGIFGKDTENAVKSFQKDNGLKVDGIVGKNTWKALFRK